MIKPLFDNIILKVKEVEKKTASGIILTGDDHESSNMATVIAVGPGKLVDGKLIEPTVKEGDEVVFSQYAGTPLTYQGEDYLVISESNILAIITGGK